MLYVDPVYFLFALPGILLGLWAQAKVHSAYQEASRIRSRRGLTGARVAREILEAEGIRNVKVEPTHGFLSDHYHPLEKALRLSEANYESDSLAAVGVAAHEVGHAIQHARGYFPLMMRSALVPVCSVGSWVAQIALLLGGLFLASAPGLGKTLLFWALLGYGAIFLFTLVTVPVEFNASRRALAVLSEGGIVTADELPEVKRVLDAAALTYVAGLVSALGMLLYVFSLYSRARE
ncbi:MAG TPA: zinc metallopeptidase [Planctomycetota bacterium]|nr:zinc metallopeptidase [Planctomycetota bacterium]